MTARNIKTTDTTKAFSESLPEGEPEKEPESRAEPEADSEPEGEPASEPETRATNDMSPTVESKATDSEPTQGKYIWLYFLIPDL